MKSKNKKAYYFMLLPGCILLCFFFWLLLRPVKIIAVHRNDNHSYVLVKNFPLTDSGRINWWLENKNQLQEKYNIPQPDPEGFFTIVFWDFGEGYKEADKHEKLCFSDMPPPVNCIDKDKLFTITKGRNKGVSFLTNDKIYRMKRNGDLVKEEID